MVACTTWLKHRKQTHAHHATQERRDLDGPLSAGAASHLASQCENQVHGLCTKCSNSYLPTSHPHHTLPPCTQFAACTLPCRAYVVSHSIRFCQVITDTMARISWQCLVQDRAMVQGLPWCHIPCWLSTTDTCKHQRRPGADQVRGVSELWRPPACQSTEPMPSPTVAWQPIIQPCALLHLGLRQPPACMIQGPSQGPDHPRGGCSSDCANHMSVHTVLPAQSA